MNNIRKIVGQEIRNPWWPNRKKPFIEWEWKDFVSESFWHPSIRSKEKIINRLANQIINNRLRINHPMVYHTVIEKDGFHHTFFNKNAGEIEVKLIKGPYPNVTKSSKAK